QKGLAFVALERKDFPAAVKALTASVTRSPYQVLSSYTLPAGKLLDARQFADARDVLSLAERAYPASADVQWQLAKALFALRDDAGASTRAQRGGVRRGRERSGRHRRDRSDSRQHRAVDDRLQRAQHAGVAVLPDQRPGAGREGIPRGARRAPVVGRRAHGARIQPGRTEQAEGSRGKIPRGAPGVTGLSRRHPWAGDAEARSMKKAS